MEGASTIEGFAEDTSERLRAEHALRASEIKYRIVADNTYDWEYWISPEGRYLYSSPSSERITGYGPWEYENQPELLAGIIHPDDKGQYEAHLAQYQTRDALCEFEYRILHRDGGIRWIGHVCQPVFDAEGRYLGRRGSNRDITDRKQGNEALREAHHELERRVEERTAELAQANVALRESKALFESLARVSPVGIFRTDATGNCIYVNERWSQLGGIRLEEAGGKDCFRSVHTEDQRRVDEEWAKTLANGAPFRSEYRSEQPGGQNKFLLGQASPEINHLGEIVGYVGTITDITEQKQAAEALRQSEELFRAVFNTLRDGVLLTDGKTGQFLKTNPAIQQMLGYSWAELEKLGVDDLHPEEALPLVTNQFKELVEGKIAIVQEVPVRRKDGSVFYADISASLPICFEGRQCLMGVFRDITERRMVQESLRNAYQELQDIIEFLPDATFVIDRQRKVVAWNRAMEEMTGVEKRDILGRADYCYAAALYGEARPILIDWVIGDGTQAEDKQYTVLERKGKTIFGEAFIPMTFRGKAVYAWATASPLYDVQGNLIGAIESIRDITTLKQTEEALRESEAKYRQLFATVPDAIIIFDADTLQFIDINDSALSLYGYTREEFLKLRITDITVEQGLSELSMKQTLTTGKRARASLQWHRKKDGTVFPVESSGGASIVAGRTVFSAALRDIAQRLRAEAELARYREHLEELVKERTRELSRANEKLRQLIDELRQTEKGLKEREEFLSAIVENIPDMIFVKEAGTLRFVRFNRAGENLLGYSRQDLIGKSDHDLFPRAEADFFTQKDRNVLRSRQLLDIPEETILTRQLGQRILHTKKIPILDSDGTPAYLLGISEDITARRHAQEALKDSEQRYRQLLGSVTDYIFTIEIRDGAPISTTHGQGCIAVTGYTPEDYVRKPSLWYEMVHPDDQAMVLDYAKTAISGETQDPLEHRIIHQDGTTRWVRNTIVPRYDSEGNFIACDGLVSDITQRKMIEQELKQTNTYLENIIENSPDAIGIVNESGRFIRWNRMAAEVCGYTFEELKGKSSFDLYADKNELNRMLVQLRKEGSVTKWEMNFMRKDGGIVPLEISIGLLKSRGHETLGSVCVARDLSGIKKALAAIRITNEQLSQEVAERKRAEEALLQSENNLRALTSQLFTIQEKERNRISKELHDGLGQDLSVLKIYLTSIQNKLTEDQEHLKNDCGFLLSRIDHNIADMRRLCYDLSPYLLEELGLTASLKHLFDEVCGRNGLCCLMDLEDVSQCFPRKTMVAVYRIFQEALTNIVKHSGATQVSLSIRKQGEQVSFCVSDNGRGFDLREAGRRPASRKGMGLFAMEERTHMLGGAIRISSKAGEGTIVSFSLPFRKREKP